MRVLCVLVQLLFALQILVAVNAVATPRHPSPAEAFPHARAAQSASTRQGEARVPQAQPRTRGGWGLTQEDEETGLCYNRYRYYDPELGRFVSADPVGLRAGANVFSYAPNAVSWRDPLGLTGEQGPRECPLDWSIVSKTGETRTEHVQLHGANNLQKPSHGVFYGDPVLVTNDAWSIAQQTAIEPATIGGTDVYVVPRPNSGFSGGFAGQGQNLDSVTIVTRAGTNQIITAFPGSGLPAPTP